MSISNPAFLKFLFAWNIFHPLTFSLYVSLDLKWVSYGQHIYGSFFFFFFFFFFFPAFFFFLLVFFFFFFWYPFSQPMSGALNPFTFKVIINIYVLIANFLIVLSLLISSLQHTQWWLASKPVGISSSYTFKCDCP